MDDMFGEVADDSFLEGSLLVLWVTLELEEARSSLGCLLAWL